MRVISRARAVALAGVATIALLGTGYTASASAANDTEPPTAPGVPRITGTTFTSVTAAWTPSTDNVGVIGYWIGIDGGTPVAAAVANGQDPSATVSGITPGRKHTLQLSARDNAGNFSPAVSVDFTTPADTQPPTAPTNLRGIWDITGGRFIWNPSTDNSGETQYGLYLDDSTKPFISGTFTVSQTELIFGPQQDVTGTHTVTVRARDRAGNVSAPSNPVTVNLP